jgi:hypothetical protein
MQKKLVDKSEQDPHETSISTKPCIVCREPIQGGARLCVHCHSAQDWTRYILRWTGVWTAMLALLPLWSGALALREIAFHDHKAEIRLEPITCTRDMIVIAVTNSGDRPGIISQSTLNVAIDKQVANEKFNLVPRTGSQIVKPGETFTLELEPRVEGILAPLPIPNSRSECEYRIITRIDSFERNWHPLMVSCPCARPTI